MDEFQQADLDAHLAERFPVSLEKGEVYGEVDAVLIEADIVGYIQRGQLNPSQRRSMREMADQLTRSLDAFPPDARPYYERLRRMAQRAAASG